MVTDRDNLTKAHLVISQLLKSRAITEATRRSAEILKTQIEAELAEQMAEGKLPDRSTGLPLDENN